MFKFIANDDSEKLDAALAKGGKVNEQNKKGETLVMACVESGALECLKLLLSRGADLELRDKNGDTAAIRAVKNGEVQALEALVSHRPRCALAADSSGWTALHWAVKLTEAATLELLLENHEAKELILKAGTRIANAKKLARHTHGEKNFVVVFCLMMFFSVKTRKADFLCMLLFPPRARKMCSTACCRQTSSNLSWSRRKQEELPFSSLL